jgi:hypothetical protein
MAIKKTEIRAKIEERLRTLIALNPAGATPITVVNNPFREIEAEELPCIKIGFEEGEAEEFNNKIEYKREDRLVIAYIALANDSLQETLEKAEEVISDFMIRDHNNNEDENSLYSVFDMLKYRGWSSQYEKGEVSVAAVKLKFDVTYYTEHTLEFDDFNTAFVEIKPHGATDDTRIIASDTIDLSDS